MNEPKIKIQAGRQMSSLPTEETKNQLAAASETEEVTVPLFPKRSKHLRGGRVFAFVERMKKKTPVGRIWMPALLATCTGVLLGVCLLMLFKGQTTASAGAATTAATDKTAPTSAGQKQSLSGAATSGATLTLPGAQLYVWQVGSFNNLSQAQTATKQIAAKGLQATIRSASGGVYQLYAGVAADIASGAALAGELQQAQVSAYAKPYTIEPRTGTIPGVKSQDGSAILAALKQETALAAQVMPLAATKNRDAKQVSQLEAQLSSQNQSIQNLHALLAQAGLTAQAAQLDTMHGQLAQSIQLLSHRVVLPSENALAAFYVDYEALIAQLIKTQGSQG